MEPILGPNTPVNDKDWNKALGFGYFATLKAKKA